MTSMTQPQAPDHDAFLVTCSSRQLLARLADKWVTLVLCALVEGRTRNAVLARRISGVSQKMLTQTLRNLERDGLIDRFVTPTVPVTVEYELTPLGRSLVDVFLELKRWADLRMDEVAQCRARYDARPAQASARPAPADAGGERPAGDGGGSSGR